jgi:hypothetical protein
MHVPSVDRSNCQLADRRSPPASGYGIGWVIDDSEWGPFISHAGGMGGTVAQLILIPREGIAISAMANTFCSIPHAIETYVLPAILSGYAEKLAEKEKKKTSVTQTPPAPEFKVIPELLGDWHGIVHSYQKDLKFTLSFKPSGDIHAKLGEQQQRTLVNDAKYANGWLTGKMAGRTETDDACHRPYNPFHHLELDLKHRGDTITGAMIQIACCALSHWVELKR